jgi:hypothetical protein
MKKLLLVLALALTCFVGSAANGGAAPQRAAACYYGQLWLIGYPYVLRCDPAGDWILTYCPGCYSGGGGCDVATLLVKPQRTRTQLEPYEKKPGPVPTSSCM